MSITASQLAILNGAGTATNLLSYVDGSANQIPAHVFLDATGAIVSPATSTGQTAAQTSLTALVAAIGQLPTGSATAALQTSMNNNLIALLALLAPVTTRTVMTAGGSAVAVGRYVEVNASAAGNVSLQTTAGAQIVPVPVGISVYPYAATAVNTTGTTATATYANLN